MYTTSSVIIEHIDVRQAVYKWYRRQSSDSDTPLPYMCACVGSSLWLRYSMFIEDIKLILLQTYAVVMQVFFLTALIFYRSKKRRLMRALLSLVLFLFALFIYVEALTHEDGKILIGRFASGSQIAGSLYRAFKTKVIDFIPFAPVAFTWIMELHAIVYSIGINDFYMLVSVPLFVVDLANTTFFLMDGSLLSMFLIYPTERKTRPTTTQHIHVL
ncbi:unnamed protein product [Toxocara canis]|uniref:Sugar transporter SWEET1 n=1 Tax=Toxocara canis TaxID=6265 RepID=A0A183VFA0_TOXCA|nr:unnamed protein product [Toxocara canis]